MKNNIPNKNTARALGQKSIAGVDKYFAKVKQITLAGTTFTPSTLKAVFQDSIDATDVADAGRAQWKQQVATAEAARAKARDVRKALKAYLLGNFGADAVGMLEDFGIPVPKPKGVKTAESKANAVRRARATREAKKGQKPVAPATNATTPPAA